MNLVSEIQTVSTPHVAHVTDGDPTLVDLLDRIIDRGALVTGDVVLSVAGVDLIHLDLRLALTGIDDTSSAP